MRCLIGYDIADARRLRRVQRHLSQYARPLQRSIYLLEGTEALLSCCQDGLQQRIDPTRDDVRLYSLTQDTRLLSAGRLFTPDGVWLSPPTRGR
ncbi:CRISPR-associated endonuclease Cas2 [Laribacter hongkongensis]|nr:CRISPR-associated endonuclease Cas2 [Laribacter hongkongensis]MCG9084136.1 CRISPR-associated endonuclease Cas2 [Laribacter hongkongensis]MCG9086534.1 CRISPR-associated endonuclease Cas2 [Laribacter hongkongensis]